MAAYSVLRRCYSVASRVGASWVAGLGLLVLYGRLYTLQLGGTWHKLGLDWENCADLDGAVVWAGLGCLYTLA